MESKLLNSYKGFAIEKSWNEGVNGVVKKETVLYLAYDEEGDLYDGAKTLPEIKRKIDCVS